MSTTHLCKCGHQKHEHDRAYPSGKTIHCCRQDVGCACVKYEASDKVQPSEERKS